MATDLGIWQNFPSLEMAKHDLDSISFSEVVRAKTQLIGFKREQEERK